MLNNTEEILNKFAKRVIQQSRTRLTKGKKNASKDLYNSLRYDLTTSAAAFILNFFMEEYGIYQDRGVSGKKRKYNTPFSYKDKMPPPKALDKWMVRRNIKGTRDAQGRFIKRKSLQYLLARSIYNKGIKPSNFFTKSFEQAFDKLPEDMVKAYRLDLEEFLRSSTIGN
jgi:hypothetical protein|tara:strand:+ start:292 stop:798 length:507 start_codon:yes stop_codon:yes gene_type:complete